MTQPENHDAVPPEVDVDLDPEEMDDLDLPVPNDSDADDGEDDYPDVEGPQDPETQAKP